MSRARYCLLAALSVMIGIVGFLLVAEIVLQFLPVGTGLRAADVTAENPVFHFTPSQSFVFSEGADLAMVNRGHVNNAGFVNDQDYRKRDPLPLLAIVGDSYIEAQMVPFASTVEARVAAALAGKYRVYSFGASGAPLSQYLIWARFAVQEYGARAVVITVVGNDFDESLMAYKSAPGFWYYAPDAKGELRLRLVEFHRGFLRTLFQYSALAHYLYINVGLNRFMSAMNDAVDPVGTAIAAEQKPYFGNTAAEASPQRVADSQRAIDAFFRDLPALVGLPPNRILFITDGFRYPDVAVLGAGSYFDRMRRAFRAKAQSLGYEVIDLDPLFFARHRKTGERFDYPRDAHWNAIGHEVAASAILSSKLVAQLLEK